MRNRNRVGLAFITGPIQKYYYNNKHVKNYSQEQKMFIFCPPGRVGFTSDFTHFRAWRLSLYRKRQRFKDYIGAMPVFHTLDGANCVGWCCEPLYSCIYVFMTHRMVGYAQSGFRTFSKDFGLMNRKGVSQSSNCLGPLGIKPKCSVTRWRILVASYV